MKITIERSWIDVLGVIWLPPVKAGMRIDLSAYDMDNIGKPTRRNVELWLTTHTGDFQYVTDFHAVIGETEIPWKSEVHEIEYCDCTCPD